MYCLDSIDKYMRRAAKTSAGSTCIAMTGVQLRGIISSDSFCAVVPAGAFVYDFDGNNIEAVCRSAGSEASA